MDQMNTYPRFVFHFVSVWSFRRALLEIHRKHGNPKVGRRKSFNVRLREISLYIKPYVMFLLFHFEKCLITSILSRHASRIKFCWLTRARHAIMVYRYFKNCLYGRWLIYDHCRPCRLHQAPVEPHTRETKELYRWNIIRKTDSKSHTLLYLFPETGWVIRRDHCWSLAGISTLSGKYGKQNTQWQMPMQNFLADFPSAFSRRWSMKREIAAECVRLATGLDRMDIRRC